MPPKTEKTLRTAVKLIKSGKSAKARPDLIDLLRREPNNAEAWYLLSFTLEDPQRQQYALLQALRITPDFQKARTRLSKLRGEVTGATEPVMQPRTEQGEADSEKPTPAFFDEPAETNRKATIEPENDQQKEPPFPKRRGKWLPVVLIMAFLGLLVFAAWLFLPSLELTQPTATPIASRTLPATWTPSIEATQTSSSTPQPTMTPTIEPTMTPSAEGTATP